MSAEGDRPFNQAVDQIAQAPYWQKYFSHFESPASYQSEIKHRTALKQTDLEIVRIENSTKTSTFKSRDEFCDWLLSWEPHRHHLPLDLQRLFYLTAIAQYCALFNHLETLSITLPGILLEVRKPLNSLA